MQEAERHMAVAARGGQRLQPTVRPGRGARTRRDRVGISANLDAAEDAAPKVRRISQEGVLQSKRDQPLRSIPWE